jgi:hypothetical protein
MKLQDRESGPFFLTNFNSFANINNYSKDNGVEASVLKIHVFGYLSIRKKLIRFSAVPVSLIKGRFSGTFLLIKGRMRSFPYQQGLMF